MRLLNSLLLSLLIFFCLFFSLSSPSYVTDIDTYNKLYATYDEYKEVRSMIEKSAVIVVPYTSVKINLTALVRLAKDQNSSFQASVRRELSHAQVLNCRLEETCR